MTSSVVLLSGGLDSTVAAAIVRHRGDEIVAASFDYGQRHDREVRAARAVAKALDVVDHRVLRPDIGALGGSALTDDAMEVPRDRDEDAMSAGIPATYVPARNTIMLAYGLALAEVTASDAVVIGANALDYSGYPDCRPAYLEAFQRMANLATKRAVEGDPVRIEAPLVEMTKADIVAKGIELDAPLHLTWSCYVGGEVACGRCDSCKLRLKGFREAGAEDPLDYATA